MNWSHLVSISAKKDSQLAILGLCGHCRTSMGMRLEEFLSLGDRLGSKATIEFVKIHFLDLSFAVWISWVSIFSSRSHQTPHYIFQTPRRAGATQVPNVTRAQSDLQPWRRLCQICSRFRSACVAHESCTGGTPMSFLRMPEPVGCTWSPPKCGWKSLESRWNRGSFCNRSRWHYPRRKVHSRIGVSRAARCC